MATIEEMLVDIARRLTSSFVAVSLMLMALSACASGPMTIAEMICCVDHHDDCEMAGQAESCCAPDQPSGMSMTAKGRADTTHVAPVVVSQMVVTVAAGPDLSAPEVVSLTGVLSAVKYARPRPPLLTELLI